MRKLVFKKDLPKLHENEHTHISINKRFKTNDIVHEYIKESYLQSVKVILTIRLTVSKIDPEIMKKNFNKTTHKECLSYCVHLIKKRYPKMPIKQAWSLLYNQNFTIHFLEKTASFIPLAKFLSPMEVVVNG